MPIRSIRYAVLAALALGGAAVFPSAVIGQNQPARLWEPRGFDFAPSGVWRTRARQVAAARAAALARGDFPALNRAISAASGNPALFMSPEAVPLAQLAITGVLRVPVFLVRFKNTNVASLRPAASYDSVLLSTPPLGRSYNVRTFYEEISHGLLSVQGVVVGWITLDSNDTWYPGPGTCDGLCFSSHIADLIREAVTKSDATIDFRQFDNDGPDGIPNSGDDDGQVDLIWLIQPKQGAECGVDGNIWAHRFYYSFLTGAPLATADSAKNGRPITINNYTIQSGVGGSTSCDATQIMPPGTIAHETGHGLGLPDFYDTDPNDQDNSEGIGHWGLMGSGNYARPLSPAHMEAFSLSQLGWITLRQLTGGGTYHFGPVELGDTAFLVRPTVSNPRSEYFLLENRQPQGSDTALTSAHGPGLLIWHVDSTQYALCALPNNCVNTGPIHGLALMQADGLDNLGSSTPGIRNRGDAGDPYPGSTGNRSFTLRSRPAPTMNSDGGAAGLAIDSITQVVPSGEMSFRLRIGGITTVRASDTTAQIRVSGTAFNVFRDVFNNGDTATISIDSAQLSSSDDRIQFLFSTWSDNGARTHFVSLSSAGGSFTANLAPPRFLVVFNTLGSGSVAASGGVASSTFIAQGDSVTLTAVPAAGQTFAGWGGDTVTQNTVLKLRMTRPWAVFANFVAQLAVVDTVLRAPVMGAAYEDTIRVSGGAGGYQFTLAGGSLPPGLTLTPGGVITGTPSKDGTYSFTARVASGTQSLDLPLRLAVTAPTLALTAVVNQYLTGTGSLTPAELRYLDLLGNNNGQLDIGDFTAWLDKTGNSVNAEVMRRIMVRSPR